MLQERVLLQVRTNGINGTDTIDVYHNQGGQNPRSVSVNTASFPDPASLHAAIATGLNGLGLGLIAVNHPAAAAGALSGAPDTFKSSNFVEIRNAKSSNVTKIELDGVPGQTLVTETADPLTATAQVPALSTLRRKLREFGIAPES